MKQFLRMCLQFNQNKCINSTDTGNENIYGAICNTHGIWTT